MLHSSVVFGDCAYLYNRVPIYPFSGFKPSVQTYTSAYNVNRTGAGILGQISQTTMTLTDYSYLLR